MMTIGELMSEEMTNLFVVYALVVAGLFITGIVAAIIGIVIASIKMTAKEASIWNLVIKIAYIPAYVMMICCLGASMNIFLIWVSWIPVLFCILFIGMTGTVSIGTSVRCAREGKIKKSAAVAFSLLSYVFIADFIVAIVQVAISGKSHVR